MRHVVVVIVYILIGCMIIIALITDARSNSEANATALVETEIIQLKLYQVADPETLVVEATAYTSNDQGMDGKGITKSGLPADFGVVAVDPEVIPLGSMVHIPGIGYAVALDTGGAIKGNRIDIYMESRDDALEWGRQKVEIKVFKP